MKSSALNVVMSTSHNFEYSLSLSLTLCGRIERLKGHLQDLVEKAIAKDKVVGRPRHVQKGIQTRSSVSYTRQ